MGVNSELMSAVDTLELAAEASTASALIEDYFFVNELEISVAPFTEVLLIP